MAGELLPTLQAQSIQESLSEFLTTTFSLADRGAQQALDDFLTDPEDGIFKGPFIRTRTPFKPTRDAANALDIPTGPFDPYGHQAAAFARLTSKGLANHERPQPTLVTTGTGSGKTESFLYPILDHIRRHKRRGGTGMSALILYPMNALALDQAQRLARMLVDPANPELVGIRAGFYVGDSGDAKRSMVTSDGLITERRALQENPPDILLTNYKMLDRLLLRPADQRLWDESALSLQYLVLDEFHTYDGAQGTDVAMLLRRLGAALKRRWPAEHAALTPEHRARPLGRITPVATSATLGDEGDPSAILDFARTVFGEDLDRSAVVTESRYTVEEWTALTPDPLRDGTAQPIVDGFPTDELSCQRFSSIDAARALAFITGAQTLGSPDDDAQSTTAGPRARIIRTAATLLTTADRWVDLARALGDRTAGGGGGDASDAVADGEPTASSKAGGLHPAVPELIRHHPAVQEVASRTVSARPLDVLAGELRTTPDYLSSVVGLLSAVRAEVGRAALTIDAHLWVREVSRIDRVAGGSAEFRWFDDAVTDVASQGEQDWDDNARRAAFPAVFCRNCGRSGWAVQLSPDGGGLDNPERDKDIRKGRLQWNERVRVLLTADGEAEAFASSNTEHTVLHPFLRDFNPRERTIGRPEEVFGPIAPTGGLGEELAAGHHLPVLVDLTDDGGANAVHDVCPACGEKDTIRFLGAAIATLLSVSVSTLFGDEHLDNDEKKSLVFTDSVQDAAHRAGFVEARSHTFTTRAVLADAAAETCTLADIADVAIRQAGDDSFARYRMLAPQLTDGRFDSVDQWWRKPQTTDRAGYELVRRRLAFDAALEFGLQGRVGRTLELTGTAQAEVDLPDAAELEAVTAALFTDETGQTTGIVPDASARVAWVRGIVEHMRMRGAIHHEWLDAYVKDAGKRYRVWGGRRRDQGMPAFPAGRAAPIFAYAGARPGFATEFEKVDEANAWYGRYAARVLGVERRHGAGLTASLLRALAQYDEAGRGAVRTSAAQERRSTVFGLEPSRVRLTAEESPATLLCSVCQTEFPMGARARAELEGSACLLVTCSGELETRDIAGNFYRDLYTGTNLRRVVAREHSSILDAKERKKTEDGFKAGGHDPSTANVLVATPTLEMGIDIGDLSTVMLSSLPRTVANYVQRVGRAGRLTGNALTVAFVEGRGRQRPQLADPLAVIDGAVRPPATYLDAVEIIQRQYLAFLFDRVAMDPERHGIAASDYPRTAPALFGQSTENSTLLSAVLALNADRHADLLEEFLAGFGDQIDLAATELRAWAQPGADGSSGLSRTVWAAHRDFLQRRETLTRRIVEINDVVVRYMEQRDDGILPEEDKEPFQQAFSALKATRQALTDMEKQDWVSALETVQLLPNYTLLDDSTDLDVIARWRDDETAEWKEEPLSFGRGARVALRDFAPGSTFYGRGLQVRIDAVDLGAGNEDVYTLAFCSACGYTHDSRAADTGADDDIAAVPRQCPRCGNTGIADRGQRIKAVQFRRAMAMVNRDEAGINDRDDDRAITMYSIVSLADIDPSHIASRWYTLGLDFGISHLSRVRITTVNLGQQRRALPTFIGGEEVAASLFTVCESCGVLDRSSGENSRKEHRPWCPLRDARDERTVSIGLTHLLDTQGALMRLPHELVTGDHLAVPSFMAALQVGLREALGGEPDHISLLRTQEPLEDGGVVDALLLHDIVPGGTGYLADLCRPEKLWDVLASAYRVVRDCVCAGTEIACAKCLLPFVPQGSEGLVSRQSAQTTLESLLRAGRSADTATAAGPTPHAGEGRGAGTGDGLGDGIPWTGWEVTEETPQKPADDSALEGQFRAVLRERLTHQGYHVQEAAMSTGTGLAFNLPQSELRWRLVPQVAKDFVKPDFLLECTSTQVPTVAVFTDGYRYHAHPTNNIVADDAWKRSTLRLREGWPVVSAVYTDVQASRLDSAQGHAVKTGTAGGEHGIGTRGGFLGDWLVHAPAGAVQGLRSQPGANGAKLLTWPDGAEDFLTGPVEILLRWIQAIDDAQTSGGSRGMGAGFGGGLSPVEAAVDAVRGFAASSVWMLGVGRAGLTPQPVRVGARAGGPSLAQQLADELTLGKPLERGAPQADTVDERPAFLLREGPLGILFVPAVDGSGRASAAVVLDDRESQVSAQGFRDTWIAWLHLSTLLSFASMTADIVVTTVRAVMNDSAVDSAATFMREPAAGDGAAGGGDAAARGPVVDYGETAGGPTVVSAGWESLLASDEVMPEERSYLEKLMAAGIANPPDVGEESESGVYLDVSWADERIAVLLAPEDDDFERATSDGWTVVSEAVASVKSALESAREDIGTAGGTDAGQDDDGENRGEN